MLGWALMWDGEVGFCLSSGDVFHETSAGYRVVEPISGSNVIPRRARPGLAGLRLHTRHQRRLCVCEREREQRERGPHVRSCAQISMKRKTSAFIADPNRHGHHVFPSMKALYDKGTCMPMVLWWSKKGGGSNERGTSILRYSCGPRKILWQAVNGTANTPLSLSLSLSRVHLCVVISHV